MLGKCLWKMNRFAEDEWDPKLQATKPTMDAILKPFLRAIETCPKPRDGRQEPILEPNYKLVSIVYKAVFLYGCMEAQDGADLLQKQQYSMNKGAKVTISNAEDWEEFILNHLKILRGVDKQHWQHRMVNRVASIIYDENQPDFAQATSARNEFQSSIFTKTMQVVVWKPEAERPGRHCVYMERYVRQMIKLLWRTDDKENMELLVKRVRKKPNEFFRFAQLWSECCSTYVRLIRRTFNISATMEEMFRSIPTEEFEILTERVTTQVANPNMTHPSLQALREASELKKINSNLMKPAPIDDLINDAYATLYIHVQQNSGPLPKSQTLGQFDGEAGPSRGAMSLNNLVMDMNGTQISVPVTVASADPATRKRYGISKREVMKQAEMLVSRAPMEGAKSSRVTQDAASSFVLGSNAGPAKARSKSASGTPRVGSERADNHEGGDGEEGDGEGDESESENDNDNDGGEDGDGGEEDGAEGGDGEVQRNEIDDDADDESDLSDVEGMEDIDESTIFA